MAKDIAASQAFAAALEKDPSQRVVVERAQARLRELAANREFWQQTETAIQEMIARLAKASFPMPDGDFIEQLLYVCEIIRVDPKSLSCVDIERKALAWIDREKIRNKIRSEAEASWIITQGRAVVRSAQDPIIVLGEDPAGLGAEDPADAFPPDSGWHTEPGAFWFRGERFVLIGKPLELLKLFARSRESRNLSYDDLREAWTDGPIVDEASIRTHIGTLRAALRKVCESKLLDIKDPLPHTREAGWCFAMPRA